MHSNYMHWLDFSEQLSTLNEELFLHLLPTNMGQKTNDFSTLSDEALVSKLAGTKNLLVVLGVVVALYVGFFLFTLTTDRFDGDWSLLIGMLAILGAFLMLLAQRRKAIEAEQARRAGAQP